MLVIRPDPCALYNVEPLPAPKLFGQQRTTAEGLCLLRVTKGVRSPLVRGVRVKTCDEVFSACSGESVNAISDPGEFASTSAQQQFDDKWSGRASQASAAPHQLLSPRTNQLSA